MSSTKKNMNDSSIVHGILFVILLAVFIWLLHTAIVDNTQASYLKEVCTETTYGREYSTEHSKITSMHTVAVYEINGRQYKCKGMYQDEPDTHHVLVHYNPNNVSEAYCGKGPICTGFMEGITLVTSFFAIVFVVYGYVKKRKNA